MSYSIHYVGTEEKKRAQAMIDIESYLGTDRFNDITEMMRVSCQQQTTLELMMSFAGVSGYPARVWAEHILELRTKTVDHA